MSEEVCAGVGKLSDAVAREAAALSRELTSRPPA
jgi:hypothetical protein